MVGRAVGSIKVAPSVGQRKENNEKTSYGNLDREENETMKGAVRAGYEIAAGRNEPN